MEYNRTDNFLLIMNQTELRSSQGGRCHNLKNGKEASEDTEESAAQIQ